MYNTMEDMTETRSRYSYSRAYLPPRKEGNTQGFHLNSRMLGLGEGRLTLDDSLPTRPSLDAADPVLPRGGGARMKPSHVEFLRHEKLSSMFSLDPLSSSSSLTSLSYMSSSSKTKKLTMIEGWEPKLPRNPHIETRSTHLPSKMDFDLEALEEAKDIRHVAATRLVFGAIINNQCLIL